MKRKTSTTPTRIYSYGCLAPTVGAKLMDEQLWRANRYYNALVEIEHEKRVAILTAQKTLTELAPLAAMIKDLDVKIAESYIRLKAKKKGAGKRADIINEAAEIKLLKEQIKQARSDFKEAKKLNKENPNLIAMYNAAEEVAKEKVHAARAASGLYWGTYLKVEEAVEQAKHTPSPPPRNGKPPIPYERLPRFSRYSGEGKIAVQFQKGLSVNKLFGEDTRMRIVPVSDGTYDLPRNQRRFASRTSVKIRAGTVEGGRLPMWVEFPVILHRPLPEDGVAKWAWVLRRKVGLKFEYRLRIVIESETFHPAEHTGSDALAIDLGWRNLRDEEGEKTGQVRAGYRLDDKGEHCEILLPFSMIERMAKVDDLRSIRDMHFNLARDWLKEWFEGRELPEWLKERIRYLDKWHDKAKMVVLLHEWEKQRIVGDETIIEGLRAWAKKDRHLFTWEANQRDRTLNHRRDTYLKQAIEDVKKYAIICMEDLKVANLSKKAAPEKNEPDGSICRRRTKNFVAPAEMLSAYKLAIRKYGSGQVWCLDDGIVQLERLSKKDPFIPLNKNTKKNGTCLVLVPPAGTSRRCANCGFDEKWEEKSEKEHTCPKCGMTFDRDLNACKNILRIGQEMIASAEAMHTDAEVLAEGNNTESQEEMAAANEERDENWFEC